MGVWPLSAYYSVLQQGHAAPDFGADEGPALTAGCGPRLIQCMTRGSCVRREGPYFKRRKQPKEGWCTSGGPAVIFPSMHRPAASGRKSFFSRDTWPGGFASRPVTSQPVHGPIPALWPISSRSTCITDMPRRRWGVIPRVKFLDKNKNPSSLCKKKSIMNSEVY